jgi:fructose-1,6-bisphosphatase/sedoheptulose 1,7-bisphosphatase-like protein
MYVVLVKHSETEQDVTYGYGATPEAQGEAVLIKATGEVLNAVPAPGDDHGRLFHAAAFKLRERWRAAGAYPEKVVYASG